MIGQRLGSLRIEERLGGSAAGTMYRAVDEKTGQSVAVKVLEGDAIQGRPAYDALKRKFRAIQRLEHPNIVRILTAGRDRGTTYISMEYVEGTSLDRLIAERGKLPWEQVVRSGIEIADAMQLLHQQGVTHGNLKPSNILLTEHGRIKLTDFAIASTPDASTSGHPGQALGTATYMAPEQIHVAPEANKSTDFYALGAVLYQMLAGEISLPSTSADATMDQHDAGPPRRPSARIAKIPTELYELVAKLLAPLPADPPSDAAAVGAVLAELRSKAKLGESIPMAKVPLANILIESRQAERGFSLCIERLRSTDRLEREEAGRTIWDQFAPRLRALVRRHLDNRIRRREDENDILQSVFSSFFLGQFEGLTRPSSRAELWKVLVRITMCKVVNTAHRHKAARRDVRRERPAAREPASQSSSPLPQWMLEHVDRSQPSPEEKAIVLEELKHILQGLSPELRQIVVWKLEGFTNAEIAASIGRTVRCVELKLQLIRKRIELGESPPAKIAEPSLVSGDNSNASLGSEHPEICRELNNRREPIPIPGENPLASRPEPSRLIRRHTDVSFPARVRQGTTNHLRVQIIPAQVVLPSGEVSEIPKAHPHDATMTLKVPWPTDEKVPAIKVEISVATENFDIEGSTRARVIVPLEGKSRPVNFRLRAVEAGPGRIMVDFSQAGRPVGSVDLYPEIIVGDRSSDAPRSPPERAIDLSLEPGLCAPDLVIKVFEHRFAGQPGRLQFIVSSTLRGLRDLPVFDGDLGTIELKSHVVDWVAERLQLVGELAPRDDLTAEEVTSALAGVGHSLFDQLLPRSLQDLCWTIRARDVRSILVLSDEPHIPWELIKPFRDNPRTGEFEEDGFWGQSYALTHWLRGRPPVQKLSLNRICALATGVGALADGEAPIPRDTVSLVSSPASINELPVQASPLQLTAIDEELSAIRSLQALGSQVRFLPARRREFLGVLEQGEFDLLHLIAHGEFAGPDVADSSAVFFVDGEFRAAELSPRMAGTLRRAAPLIFFNSCHSSRTGFSLTRLGAWGAQFVHLGCGAFVGTLWPVTDRAASAFAQAFYAWMCQGLSIGEAMLRARERVRERYPNDPTWLAYCCFADPMARIEQMVTPDAEASLDP
jgi:serine/threonine protein kinase